MTVLRAVPLLALLVLLPPAAARAAMPATLACTGRYHVNWRADAPVLVETRDRNTDEPGGVTIHLDPQTGEWFLAVAGSAALTQGGGTFEVIRPSTFERYYDEWVGLDGDTMLRIWGAADLRFVFLSDDYGVLGGTCSEPAEPFILLGYSGGSPAYRPAPEPREGFDAGHLLRLALDVIPASEPGSILPVAQADRWTPDHVGADTGAWGG